MNNTDKIAEKIVARIIKADYGDVPTYFNVSDFIRDKGGDKMYSDDVESAIEILSSAVSECKGQIDKLVEKQLQSHQKELEKLGLKTANEPNVKKRFTVSKDEMDEFIKYFMSFYGRGGLYPIEDLSREDIIKGVEIRLKKRPSMEFVGDSADRELVRDIVLGWRKQLKGKK